MRISEIINKPPTPEQARLDALKRQKEAAANNLKAERKRQKIAKAQQQLRTAMQPVQ